MSPHFAHNGVLQILAHPPELILVGSTTWRSWLNKQVATGRLAGARIIYLADVCGRGHVAVRKRLEILMEDPVEGARVRAVIANLL